MTQTFAQSLADVNWYAIQTRPYQESLAAASILHLDVEMFLPKLRQEQLVAGIARLVIKPLFPGYLFARFCAALSLTAVRHSRGVLKVVGGHQVPIPLESAVIEEIRSRVQPDGFVSLARPRFQRGDKVIIEQGPFAGLMGRVEKEPDDMKRVAILLEEIGKARLLVEKRWISTVTQSD